MDITTHTTGTDEDKKFGKKIFKRQFFFSLNNGNNEKFKQYGPHIELVQQNSKFVVDVFLAEIG